MAKKNICSFDIFATLSNIDDEFTTLIKDISGVQAADFKWLNDDTSLADRIGDKYHAYTQLVWDISRALREFNRRTEKYLATNSECPEDSDTGESETHNAATTSNDPTQAVE